MRAHTFAHARTRAGREGASGPTATYRCSSRPGTPSESAQTASKQRCAAHSQSSRPVPAAPPSSSAQPSPLSPSCASGPNRLPRICRPSESILAIHPSRRPPPLSASTQVYTDSKKLPRICRPSESSPAPTLRAAFASTPARSVRWRDKTCARWHRAECGSAAPAADAEYGEDREKERRALGEHEREAIHEARWGGGGGAVRKAGMQKKGGHEGTHGRGGKMLGGKRGVIKGVGYRRAGRCEPIYVGDGSSFKCLALVCACTRGGGDSDSPV